MEIAATLGVHAEGGAHRLEHHRRPRRLQRRAARRRRGHARPPRACRSDGPTNEGCALAMLLLRSKQLLPRKLALLLLLEAVRPRRGRGGGKR